MPIAEIEALLAELDEQRLRFTVLCRGLTAEQLERSVPGSNWLVRDFIAHLATIDRPVRRFIESVRGEGADAGRSGGSAGGSIDEWNDRQVEERRERTVEELLVEMAEERSKMRALLASLTEEDLGRTIRFPGDSKRPPQELTLRQYLQGWVKHDGIHAVDMLRALPEWREELLVQRWLADPVIARYQQAMNP